MSHDQNPSSSADKALVRERLSELEHRPSGPAREPAVGRIRARPQSGPVAFQADPAATRSADPLTYEPFYGFDENPFSLSCIDPKFMYHSTSSDRVLQELADALGRGAGIMLVTGLAGVGKTTLCRSLVDQLGRRTVTSLIADRPASFDDLLQTVLIDFGSVSREEAARGAMAAASRNQLLGAVGDFAASLAPLHASAVIVLDDAHEAGPEVLEPLAALSDAADPDRRVQIVLVGEPALSTALRSNTLRPVDSQIAVRCRVDPLTREEVGGYVVHRLTMAGKSTRVEFNEAAFGRLHAVTGGLPQRVNDVCHVALTRGRQASATVIDETLVATAAADLELAPWRSPRQRVALAAVGAIVFFLLMLAGAAMAAWVFQSRFAQLSGI